MAVILGGTAGGQLLALLAAPALTRLYSPTDFGLFTVVSALSLTLGTVAALRFDLAVPLPVEERDAYSLVTLGLLAVSATAVVGTMVIAVAGAAIAQRFDLEGLHTWLWFVPLTAAVMGAYSVLNQLAVRTQRYRAIGRRNLLQAVVLVLTQIGAGAAGLRPGGLVVGLSAGHAAGVVSLLQGSGLRSRAAREGRRAKRLGAVAARYRRFPLVLTPSGLVNALGLQLPVLLIAYFYGSEVAGWLGLSQRVLALPVALIGVAAGQVYLGELVRAVRDPVGRPTILFHSTSRRLAVMGVLIAVVLLAAGPWLFGVVFGAEWAVSGEYARALSLSLAAQMIATPLAQTLTAFERTYLQLTWDIGRLVLVTGVAAACGLGGASALTTLWCFSIASAAAYTGSWLMSRHSVRRGGTAPAEVVNHAHPGQSMRR